MNNKINDGTFDEFNNSLIKFLLCIYISYQYIQNYVIMLFDQNILSKLEFGKKNNFIMPNFLIIGFNIDIHME